VLAGWTVVDLTAPLSSRTVMWPGEDPPQADVVDRHDRDGSYSRRVTLGEHSGTHFDAPVHFAPGAEAVADIPADRLVVPLRVLDITGRIGDDPDGRLEPADVAEHEQDHGVIGAGCAVFLRTGWDRYRDDRSSYAGPEGDLRFPGFGVAAARLLVEERGAVGLGIDTLGIDPGRAHDFPVHRHVSLPQGVWHLENLIDLQALPAAGAWAVVGVPRLVDASGFPARVLALVPTSRATRPPGS
jgi:kynurenine formamidase